MSVLAIVVFTVLGAGAVGLIAFDIYKWGFPLLFKLARLNIWSCIHYISNKMLYIIIDDIYRERQRSIQTEPNQISGFAKSSFLDVFLGSEYASEIDWSSHWWLLSSQLFGKISQNSRKKVYEGDLFKKSCKPRVALRSFQSSCFKTFKNF